MKNNLRNLLTLGLILLGVNSYSSESLAKKHLNVNGIMFDRSISASLQGKYPPRTNIDIGDPEYDTFHYTAKNGKVVHFEKVTPRLPLEVAHKKVNELKPLCEKLLSYYSGVPVKNIAWESAKPGMLESVRIRAKAKNYRAYLIIHDNIVGTGNMVTIAFTHNQ